MKACGEMKGPCVYILRVWDRRGAFRATLRAVTGVEVHVFRDAGAMVEFLAEAASGESPRPAAQAGPRGKGRPPAGAARR